MATQFGIKDTVGGGVKWYSCIGDEKKKVYPGGYAGALTCPNVTAFCQMESISGEFYAENDPKVEAENGPEGILAALRLLFS